MSFEKYPKFAYKNIHFSFVSASQNRALLLFLVKRSARAFVQALSSLDHLQLFRLLILIAVVAFKKLFHTNEKCDIWKHVAEPWNDCNQ